MLAVGSGASPVVKGPYGPTGEHQRDRRVTGEDRESRAHDNAEDDQAGEEGMPGVCYASKGNGTLATGKASLVAVSENGRTLGVGLVCRRFSLHTT